MVVIPSRMGVLNKRALLVCLRQKGTASRTELARSLGLSQPTTGKIVDELLKREVFEEIVSEKDVDGRRLGRPQRMLRLTQSNARFLGLHLGVTETRLARLPVGDGREERWTIRFKTPATKAKWELCLQRAARKIPEKTFWGVLSERAGFGG